MPNQRGLVTGVILALSAGGLVLLVHSAAGEDPNAQPPVAKTGNRPRPREAAPTRPTLSGSSGRTMTGPRARSSPRPPGTKSARPWATACSRPTSSRPPTESATAWMNKRSKP